MFNNTTDNIQKYLENIESSIKELHNNVKQQIDSNRKNKEAHKKKDLVRELQDNIHKDTHFNQEGFYRQYQLGPNRKRLIEKIIHLTYGAQSLEYSDTLDKIVKNIDLMITEQIINQQYKRDMSSDEQAKDQEKFDLFQKRFIAIVLVSTLPFIGASLGFVFGAFAHNVAVGFGAAVVPTVLLLAIPLYQLSDIKNNVDSLNYHFHQRYYYNKTIDFVQLVEQSLTTQEEAEENLQSIEEKLTKDNVKNKFQEYKTADFRILDNIDTSISFLREQESLVRQYQTFIDMTITEKDRALIELYCKEKIRNCTRIHGEKPPEGSDTKYIELWNKVQELKSRSFIWETIENITDVKLRLSSDKKLGKLLPETVKKVVVTAAQKKQLVTLAAEINDIAQGMMSEKSLSRN